MSDNFIPVEETTLCLIKTLLVVSLEMEGNLRTQGELLNFLETPDSRPFLAKLYKTVLLSHYLSFDNFDLDLETLRLKSFRTDSSFRVYWTVQPEDGLVSVQELACRITRAHAYREPFFMVQNPNASIELYMSSPVLDGKISVTINGDLDRVIKNLRRIQNERGVYLARS